MRAAQRSIVAVGDKRAQRSEHMVYAHCAMRAKRAKQEALCERSERALRERSEQEALGEQRSIAMRERISEQRISTMRAERAQERSTLRAKRAKKH